jgi:hypothetical protein
MLVEFIKPPADDIGDRSNTVGASEIGLCARQSWFRKQGQEPEREDGWGYRTRGLVVEAWAIERLRAADVPIEHVQRKITDGFLSCTVDLVLHGEPIDLKSFDPRLTRLPKPAHILQVQVQAALWKAPRGHLCYINASDFSDIREFTIEAVDIDSLRQRAREIMTGPMPPPEGRIAGGDECEHCLFQVACLGAPIEGKGKLSDEDQAAIQAAKDSHKVYETTLKASEILAAKEREKIRDILRAADVRRAPGLARISRRQASALDQEAMEKDGIDLSRYRKPGRVSESVTLE